MRVVKSTDDLKRLALVKGASASVGGVKFNSSSEKVKEITKPIPKVETKPEPEPQPEPKADFSQLVSAQTDALAQANAQLVSGLTQALEKLTPTDKPRKWRLTVQRDTRGILQSIDVEQQA